MHFETLPPHRHISSAPVSSEKASLLLEKYLTNSEAHPHLHPDALITPTGVTFSAHGGPMGGVVMHNLRRVAAGLRGEYLEPEATPEPEEDGATARSGKGGKKGGKRKEEGGEGWQSMSEFEREEGVVEAGEVGERSNFVGEIVEEEDGGVKRKMEEGLDKEARKRAKKERLKEEKRKKEMAKEGKSK